jgi:hypothetical protein
VRNQPAESPYSGTIAVTLCPGSGITGPVTLSLDPANLPAGVRAGFDVATLSAGTSVQLSVQAGYPDPADPTFATLIYPALGSCVIPLTATAPGSPGVTGALALGLVPEPDDFTLAFFTASGQTPMDITSLALLPGLPLVLPFEAYWTRGDYASFGPVALTVQNVPDLLTVLVDGSPAAQSAINLNEPQSLTIQGQAGLPAGTATFQLSATFQGLTRTLPVVVAYSPAPFYIQPPPAATVTVAQGQTLTFPLHLWHDDVYFAPAAGTDPAYVGATTLGCSGNLPAGLQVAFPAGTDPTGLASVPLQISAGPGLPAGGPYPVTLQATRVGAATVPAAPLTLYVQVTSPASAPALWIQDVEWGQSVVAPGLRLVAGKPALLRAQLLADRAGVPAPAVTATIVDDQGAVLDSAVLLGPAQVPVDLEEGDLPSANAPSGSSYTAILPARDIQPGIRVTIQAGAARQSLAPSVDPGTILDLTVVPVISGGLAPVLPGDAAMTQALTAFWPVQGVTLAHRAPYTTATVLPQPGDPGCAAGWAQLLSEIASLRIVDGSQANYYGFVNPGIRAPFVFGITGISRLGDGAAVGIDETAAGWFEDSDPGLDLPTAVLVHEEGHAFNLNHAPAGGAADPQLNFPYSGAAIGSWGFDPAALAAHDPAQERDIMSYAPDRHWISDWNYRAAMAFLDQRAPAGQAADAEQWVVSGWIGPDGDPHLAPLVRVACAPRPAAAGALSLALETAGGVRSIPFAADPVPDLPSGHLPFSFTVPASGELSGAEVRVPGGGSCRRTPSQGLAARSRALDAAAGDGSLVVREASGLLHLEWDARLHPYVNVIHQGARRTTLALHLAGGSADLSLAGLPAGGRFLIHYSDGLNPVVRTIPRR